jgi:hypothetical protein
MFAMRSVLVALVVLAAGCGDSDTTPSFTPLSSDGTHLRDADGRIVLMRGVNARVEGVFDVTFDDGRMALEPIPPLTAEDCTRMRSIGFNHLRLPINWSGIEPVRGEYNESYLQAVDAAVNCAGDAGLYVIVDLHQDAYSKEIGEDGAPLWAIVPPPEMLLEGPLEDLEARRTSAQVEKAFASFFDENDAHGLQADFNNMLRVVGARYAEHPAVVGFEIFNEPVIGAELLNKFHFAAAAALREAAPNKLVFFEPPAYRNFLDFQPLSAEPFPVSGAVYSPHMYTYVFGDAESSLQALTKADLKAGVDNARAEATAWGTPLYIGEYGIGPNMTNSNLWMQYQQELTDEYLASSAFWLWKEDSQGSWGVFDKVGDDWVERPQMLNWISRIYPQHIAGKDVALAYDGITRTMTLTSSGSGTHVVYVPEANASSFTATCDGTAQTPTRDAATGTIEVSCSGTLVVAP